MEGACAGGGPAQTAWRGGAKLVSQVTPPRAAVCGQQAPCCYMNGSQCGFGGGEQPMMKGVDKQPQIKMSPQLLVNIYQWLSGSHVISIFMEFPEYKHPIIHRIICIHVV